MKVQSCFATHQLNYNQVSLCHSPKKARADPILQPELCDRYMLWPASVETPCNNTLMPRLTGKTSEMMCPSPTTTMDSLSNIDHNHLKSTEHRNRVDFAMEAGGSAAGSVPVTAEATSVETANLNDEKDEEEITFRYEKVGMHLFLL